MNSRMASRSTASSALLNTCVEIGSAIAHLTGNRLVNVIVPGPARFIGQTMAVESAVEKVEALRGFAVAELEGEREIRKAPRRALQPWDVHVARKPVALERRAGHADRQPVGNVAQMRHDRLEAGVEPSEIARRKRKRRLAIQ